jgi:hypothetical protein
LDVFLALRLHIIRQVVGRGIPYRRGRREERGGRREERGGRKENSGRKHLEELALSELHYEHQLVVILHDILMELVLLSTVILTEVRTEDITAHILVEEL